MSTNENTNPETILAMSHPPPPATSAASNPKDPQPDYPNTKTEQDPRNDSINSIPPFTPIKSEAKEENQDDDFDAIKNSIAADLKDTSAPPILATIAADKQVIEQLGIPISPVMPGVWEGTRPWYWERTPGIPGMNTTYIDRDSREHHMIECQKHLKEADKKFGISSNAEYSGQIAMKMAYKAVLEAIASPFYTYQEHKERFRVSHYDEEHEKFLKEVEGWKEEAARRDMEEAARRRDKKLRERARREKEKARRKEEEKVKRKEEKARQKEEKKARREEEEKARWEGEEMARREEEKARRKQEENETTVTAFILRPGSSNGISYIARGQVGSENKRKREEAGEEEAVTGKAGKQEVIMSCYSL